MPPVQLEFLTCPTCGAPTPLVGRRQVRCIYCAAAIDVPAHIRSSIQDFELELLQLEQLAFQPRVDGEQRLADVLIVSMALIVGIYLLCWWNISIAGWGALEPPTRIVLAQLIALPLGLVFLNRKLWSDEKHDYRRAKLAFANLTFDISSLAKASLNCPRCAGPLDCRETRDIVIDCRHCKSELLIPSLLLSEQLRDALARVMAVRGSGYNRYEVLKWGLIAATAFNGIVPIFLLEGTAEQSTYLAYLTGFSWAYMFNWIFTLWALRELDTRYAVGMFVMLIPLPGFFLFQMTRVLMGLDPNSF